MAALELGDRELRTYEPVLAALRLASGGPPRRPPRRRAVDAADAPLSVARAGAEVTALAHEVANLGSRHLLGDAHTGLLLAEASCQAATALVLINLQSRPDDERRAEATELARRAAKTRAELGSATA